MAISMSGAKVDTSERDSLLGKSIDESMTTGGVSPNTEEVGWWFWEKHDEATGVAVAGVTESFAKNVTAKIDEYTANVKGIVNGMTAADINIAFKGTKVQEAVAKFIESVQNVANNYLDKLASAENTIINSVETAYATQDEDLSSNMSSDSGSLVDKNTFSS